MAYCTECRADELAVVLAQRGIDQEVGQGGERERAGDEDDRVPQREAEPERWRSRSRHREVHSRCLSRSGSSCGRNPDRSSRADGGRARRLRWCAGRSCSPRRATGSSSSRRTRPALRIRYSSSANSRGRRSISRPPRITRRESRSSVRSPTVTCVGSPAPSWRGESAPGRGRAVP